MILVTGATGNVGYRLLENLDDAAAPATAIVRTDGGAVDLPPGVEYVVGGLDDPPAPEVLQQFDQVFLISPEIEGQAEMEIIFIDALVAAGHRPRIVKMAYDGFQDPDCAVRFMQNHRLIATHLGRTGLPVVYLAPTLFMEELLGSTDAIRDEGLLPVPAGAARVALVAARDVADVAAAVLTGEADVDDGDVVVLTGPEALSFADVADRISTVFARTVEYAPITAEAARSVLREGGLSSWQVNGRLELYEWINNDAMDGVTESVRKATGHEPLPLEAWLGEARAAFLRPAGTSLPRF
ncbi:NmrA family NAD(P)-binding protein [Nocardioides sp. Iso805N]|uniref:NmrA family NAD(P)-binding protein n=1 Tax=Nocardioides sp. Iso805N TaxID=1283287 RepID=UPI000364B358|nr:NmrA family NAD(P)-binding protein [Nocardioides sp. Iso805N]